MSIAEFTEQVRRLRLYEREHPLGYQEARVAPGREMRDLNDDHWNTGISRGHFASALLDPGAGKFLYHSP